VEERTSWWLVGALARGTPKRVPPRYIFQFKSPRREGPRPLRGTPGAISSAVNAFCASLSRRVASYGRQRAHPTASGMPSPNSMQMKHR
jgi:hypothetical protein